MGEDNNHSRKNTRNGLTYHKLYPARSVAFRRRSHGSNRVARILASIGIALVAVACTPPFDADRHRAGALWPRQPAFDLCRPAAERNLSLGQLQQLGNAAAAYRRDDPNPGQLTAGDLIRVASEIRDPKIALEVGKAAATCGVAP